MTIMMIIGFRSCVDAGAAAAAIVALLSYTAVAILHWARTVVPIQQIIVNDAVMMN